MWTFLVNTVTSAVCSQELTNTVKLMFIFLLCTSIYQVLRSRVLFWSLRVLQYKQDTSSSTAAGVKEGSHTSHTPRGWAAVLLSACVFCVRAAASCFVIVYEKKFSPPTAGLLPALLLGTEYFRD